MTAEEFLAEALPLLLGVAGVVRDQPERYPEANFWCVDGAVGMQTPPRGLILAKPRDRAALESLVEAIDVELPGVVGAVPEVDEFVELWGRPSERTFGQGIYELDTVIPPPPAPGAYREAGDDDLELVFDLFTAFATESLHGNETIERSHIEARLASPEGGVGLWTDDGSVVSVCGYGSPTPNGIRIGPVYTPPELRGRGYATSLTAEVSERRIAAGRRFCFLYTDLANPTSNAIYERIGYRRVCESAEYSFA
jgi:ribosomal protein S18 acetylase RimI-like enzyme